MTVTEAGRLLGIDPQSLRVAFQRKELEQFGCAYKSKGGKQYRYLVNAKNVRDFANVQEINQ